MVGGGGGSIGLGLGVLGSSLVCDIGDISIIAVGRVLDMLDTSIGKSNRVRSGDVAGTIGLLLSVEVGLGVVISDGVGEGVGGNLISIGLGLVGGGRGVVSGGSVDGVSHNRGVDGVSDDGSGVHGVSHRVGDNRDVDSVSHRVDSVVGDGVNGVGSNHRGVDSVSQGSVDSVSNHGRSVGDNSGSNMGGEVSSGVGNTANNAGGVVPNISGGQTKESGNDESLKPSTC